MTTKERIQTEIECLGDEDLEELYSMIRAFIRVRASSSDPNLMSKLRQIEIDAPEDFAANLDFYTSRNQGAEPHIH